jgi:hypothetical protein
MPMRRESMEDEIVLSYRPTRFPRQKPFSPSSSVRYDSSSLPIAVVVIGGQPAGSQTVAIDLAAGATLKLNAGDQIIFAAQPLTGYEVQSPVSATGPATIVVSIWPPLQVNLAGGGPGQC